MSTLLIAYSKIILAMIIVGSSIVVGKIVVVTFPVFLVSELRLLLALVILIPMMLKKEKGIPTIKSKDFKYLFLLSFTGIFLFNVFMLYGLKLTSAVESGIITSITPAVVGIIATIYLKEKISKNKVIGVFLAVAGTIVIHVSENSVVETSEANRLLGNLLIICAVICEAQFIIFGKKLSGGMAPVTIASAISIFASILFMPPAIYEALHFDFFKLSLNDWLYVVYYGVVVTALAFILMYQGLSQVEASSAGVLTSVLPVSAVVFSCIFLNEELKIVHIIGLLCSISSIIIIAKNTKNEPEVS